MTSVPRVSSSLLWQSSIAALPLRSVKGVQRVMICVRDRESIAEERRREGGVSPESKKLFDCVVRVNWVESEENEIDLPSLSLVPPDRDLPPSIHLLLDFSSS